MCSVRRSSLLCCQTPDFNFPWDNQYNILYANHFAYFIDFYIFLSLTFLSGIFKLCVLLTIFWSWQLTRISSFVHCKIQSRTTCPKFPYLTEKATGFVIFSWSNRWHIDFQTEKVPYFTEINQMFKKKRNLCIFFKTDDYLEAKNYTLLKCAIDMLLCYVQIIQLSP